MYKSLVAVKDASQYLQFAHVEGRHWPKLNIAIKFELRDFSLKDALIHFKLYLKEPQLPF